MSNTHFSGRFVVNHLVLLRKKEGESRYEMVRKFGLMNERISSTQGELFN